ncbi:MAG: hypothetical protein QOJ67_4149, partial [Acidimicrobiaceae bacterium]
MSTTPLSLRQAEADEAGTQEAQHDAAAAKER